jgi:hydrogenase expression/formation protein HypC
MCLGIPGRVVETYQEHGLLMGKIDFSGVSKRACLEHVPEVKIGEYVMVHVGFALARIDEAEAHRVLDFLRQIKQDDELAEAPP